MKLYNLKYIFILDGAIWYEKLYIELYNLK